MPTEEQIYDDLGRQIQEDVVPYVAGNAFALDAVAHGYGAPASDERFKQGLDGGLYCVQSWRDPDNMTVQHIVTAKVVNGTLWWEKRHWSVRRN